MPVRSAVPVLLLLSVLGCSRHAVAPDDHATPSSAVASRVAAPAMAAAPSIAARMTDVRVWRAGEQIRIRIAFESSTGGLELTDLLATRSLQLYFDTDRDPHTGVLGWEAFVGVDLRTPLTAYFMLAARDEVEVDMRVAGRAVMIDVPVELFFPDVVDWQARFHHTDGQLPQTIDGTSDLSAHRH